MQTQAIYIYKNWHIYPELNRIIKEDQSFQLEPKVMQVLLLLIKTPAEVVSKEAIMQKVWKDTIVSEVVVSRSISHLRKIFEDNPDTPEVIETIRTRGYRWIAPLTESPKKADPAKNNQISLAYKIKDLFSKSRIGMILLSFIVLSGMWFLFNQSNTSSVSLQENIIPKALTAFEGTEMNPQLSPSGEYVAYSWNGNQKNNWDIYILHINSGKNIRLTHALEHEIYPVWSPKGDRLAYLKLEENKWHIYTISTLGDKPLKVFTPNNKPHPDLAWSTDGKNLLFSDQYDERPHALYQLNLKTKELLAFTNPPSQSWGDFDPQFSPNGKQVIFTRLKIPGSLIRDLYITKFDAGAIPRKLTKEDQEIEGLCFSSDKKSIIYSSNRSGTSRLWKLPISGGTPKLLPLSENHLTAPSQSKHTLVFQRKVYDSDIWEIKLPDQLEGKTDNHKILASTGIETNPKLAPNGKDIAFVSLRDGVQEIWISKDGEVQKLTELKANQINFLSWSPSGKKMAFSARIEDQSKIFISHLENSVTIEFLADEHENLIPNWSADGQWLYFSSNRLGSWQVWKKHFQNDQIQQVTFEGGFAGKESPNGKSLYFIKRDKQGLWQQDLVSQSNPVKLIEDMDPTDWGSWEVTPTGVFYLQRKMNKASVAFFDLENETTSIIFELKRLINRNEPSLTVSQDGKRILYVQRDNFQSDLMMVKDF